MQDAFGRTITYLRLSVTDRCNLRCGYCMPSEGACRAVCSADELYRMAEAAVRCGITKIRITGGEPLMRSDVVPLCRRLRALPGLCELALTTNGIFLSRDAKPLKDAGVDRLNVSLDTLRPDRYAAITHGGSLARVLDGIRAAEEAGFDRLKLNCVLLGGVNDDEIAEFAELTRKKPYSVRFIEQMPMGSPLGSYLPADAVLARCPGLSFCKTDGVSRLYRFEDGAGTVGLIAPISHPFCEGCNRIRITADGMLKPCLHSAREIPLRGLSPEQMFAAIRQGISEKPQQHALHSGHTNAVRPMAQIGG